MRVYRCIENILVHNWKLIESDHTCDMSGSAIIQSAEKSIVVIRASFNDDND